MSSDEPAVAIRDVGKAYRLGRAATSYSLREALSSRLHRPLRQRERDILWAIRHVDLEIAEGEAMGLIGPNGAGKSTLLKMLSRITPPSEGEIAIRGRVGSLLEVGTGFHPELTGRENIFLNGSILGMRRSTIAQRFDEIVDFAGIERFLDTPVKRYSSGMYVRLAFAVAAHLETDVLLVDEVLAVGDLAFQQKCLTKMHDVAVGGRTVVFVSHNLAAVEKLCDRVTVIIGGHKAFEGSAHDAVASYLAAHIADERELTSSTQTRDLIREVTGGPARERRLVVRCGDDAIVDFVVSDPSPFRQGAVIGLALTSQTGQQVAGFHTRMTFPVGELPELGPFELQLLVKRLSLAPGTYTVDVGIDDFAGEMLEYQRCITTLEVLPADVFGSGFLPTGSEGSVYFDHSWRIRRHPS